MRSLLPLFALATLGVSSFDDDDEDFYERDEHGEDMAKMEDNDDDLIAGDKTSPSAVYVMEHGFLSADSPTWLPRGTLLLSGMLGHGFEARLSDAKEFVELRPELQELMTQAGASGRYYAIRMYSPESPKRVLQASIPAKLLVEHFEDWHDILEVTVGPLGVPVSLSYRVRHTLGLMLFDHTQVHISEPGKSEGPRVPPPARDGTGAGGAGKAGQESQGGFLRRYWWVIVIVLLVMVNAGDDGGKGGQGNGGAAEGGGGGGGGGGGRAGGRGRAG